MQYAEFVASRAKPGNAILKELDARRTELLHAAIGIVGELYELDTATDAENEREELGDLCFYVQMARNTIDRPYIHSMTNEHSLYYRCRDFINAVKGLCIYGKYTSGHELSLLLDHIEDALHYRSGMTLDSIRQSNMDKLIKRYPNGYSDEAAQARADKK